MKYDILNRWTKAVQFTAEIECDENAAPSVKLGLAIRVAAKAGADLRDANLRDANLRGANLSGANLRGAHGLNPYVKCIQIDTYAISYTSDVLQIGCQRHAIADWQSFSDAQIRAMDGVKALAWWQKYKDWIFQTIALCPAEQTQEVAA